MIRTLNVAEHNLTADPAPPVTVPDSVATDVLPNQAKDGTEEIAYRYVQNCGGVPTYYAIGQDASPVNYNGILQAWQQLDCSNHRLKISFYCAGGTTGATTVIRRNKGV